MTVINIIAASLLAVAATLAFSGNRFIQEREIAAGRVTDRIAVRGQKGTTYKIVATFTDKAGRSNAYESSSPSFRSFTSQCSISWKLCFSSRAIREAKLPRPVRSEVKLRNERKRRIGAMRGNASALP